MATDKIRKYVLPNIPYLFIGWFCLKIGTAYRLAAGAGFGEKLLGLGQTIGAAFASFAPGLAPLDWFVGIVGAAGFWLLIYYKAKKAKKFRHDAEYGTARWGNEKDIKPFVDPKFENNVLLTATERLTMNTRPKNPANARNLNFCGIGSSGSGKTRFWLTPQLLQAHSSYVVVDPKGGVLGQVGAFLQRRGYQIKVFNSIDFSKSMHYNPLSYIRNEADILKFVNALITNTKGEGKEGDPFWTKAETLLYRTVTRTDSEGNDYEVEVPYNYYICYVTLENFNLSHVPVYMMSEEQLSMYALYMSTLGNRPDLFPSSGYIGKYITNRPPEHEVPESYLDDETFAAILKEAEKYLGFPYVWGGSSPSTSFDCSGFVSYVYNQCGWSFGRLGAQGLYNICSRTSSPRPGDLVFFVGTYDTAGISHVGIYVGDGWMLHCGDPISYANLNSSYWQSHLYAYGRLP